MRQSKDMSSWKKQKLNTQQALSTLIVVCNEEDDEESCGIEYCVKTSKNNVAR